MAQAKNIVQWHRGTASTAANYKNWRESKQTLKKSFMQKRKAFSEKKNQTFFPGGFSAKRSYLTLRFGLMKKHSNNKQLFFLRKGLC